MDDNDLARSYFDPEWYRVNYSDVLPLGLADLFEHFMEFGWKRSYDPNPYFDTDWYVNVYRDSIAGDVNPLIHFITRGQTLGEVPSLFFDSNWYLEDYPDVKSSGMNPLLHYLAHGNNEGRLPFESRISHKVKKILSGETVIDSPHLPVNNGMKIAILIPVHNNWHLTEICLRSLFALNEVNSVEVFILNDASTDATRQELKRFSNVTVIESDENLGFTRAVNAGFKQVVTAGFEYIYLLNNDTFVLPGFLASALKLMQSETNAAMVGSKLLNLDGTLQECGGIIWNDGTGANFGRNTIADEVFYDFSRPVDYCSGAGILLDSAALKEVGYFDEQFAPAYYEDTDLAFKFRGVGREVWVSSGSEIIHFEGGSHGTDINFGVKKSQEVNRLKFADKWQLELENHFSNSPENHLLGAFRLITKSKRAVIWVDDRYPDPSRDSGSVRASALLKIAKLEDLFTVFVSTADPWENEIGNSLRNIGQPASTSFKAALEFLSRINVDPWFIWVSRITSATEVFGDYFRNSPNVPLVFDTVDLHFLRLERELKQGNPTLDEAHVELVKGQELAMMRFAKKTILVSQFEQKYLEQKHDVFGTSVISNVHQNTTELPKFETTKGIVFIGGYNHWPNVQGIVWFVSEVWPLVDIEVQNQGLTIAGSNLPPEIKCLEQKNINVIGWIEDSQALVRSSRISIAPLLTGAGVKGKIGQALSQGIPVIGTSIATEGMGFINNTHGIVANSPIEFAHAIDSLYHSKNDWNQFQHSGQDLIRCNFSPSVAKDRFMNLLETL